MADVELLPLPEPGLIQSEAEFVYGYDRDDMHAYARANLATLQAENERLAEALRSSANAVERLAFAIPAPNAHTPQLVELAIAMRAAALAQEDRND